MSEETKQQLKNIHDKVLEAIHTDAVTMRSRYYFIARSALWILGVTLAFSVMLYLVSFIAFIFRGNSLLLLPHIGPGGWMNLFISLPWMLLFFVFALFVVLQILSTHFSFVYKRPLVHTILASIFLLTIGSVAIGQMTLHERAYELNEGHPIPLTGALYENAIRDHGNIHTGKVTEINGTEFNIRNRNGKEYTVSVTPDTKVPPVKITEDTLLMVIGDEDDGIITADGVRPIDKGRPVFPHEDRQERESIR